MNQSLGLPMLLNVPFPYVNNPGRTGVDTLYDDKLTGDSVSPSAEQKHALRNDTSVTHEESF